MVPLQERFKAAGEYLRSKLHPGAIRGFEILTDDPMWGLYGRSLRRRKPGEPTIYEQAQIRDRGGKPRTLEAYRSESGRLRVRTINQREK